jgi:thiamine kinase-like enzyme
MTNLYVDENIGKWLPEVIQKMPEIHLAYKDHPEILSILKHFEKTFLFSGCQDYYQKLVPRDSEIVLAHNDAQENNILASLEDATEVIFIDFEYTGWNPRGMDIANYFNETMLDNAHPLKKGIKYYLQNLIKD